MAQTTSGPYHTRFEVLFGQVAPIVTSLYIGHMIVFAQD